MRTLKFLLQKEFLQVFRNRMMLFVMMAMPTIMLLVLPWAATFEQKNIRLCVLDNDNSPISNRMIEKLSASAYFDLVKYSSSYDEAFLAIERGEADLILEIPQNFEKNIFREKKIDFMLDIDALNGQKAGVALSYITQNINQYLQEFAQKFAQEVPQIEVKPQYRYNARMKYFPFMVPGIFVILLTAMTVMLSALNIVREKEIGTIVQINVSPITKASFIIGKVVVFWVIGLVILSIGIIIARLMYGIVPAGSVLSLYLVAFIYIVAMTGIGFIISNIADTQQQAMMVTFFVLMICILLGGLFTPINSMPAWAKWITVFNPFRYMVEAVRLIYLKGSSLVNILPQIYKLLGFMVVLNFFAIVSYRKRNG
jgi:ABC-2 type transport system permease protein